MIDKFKKLENLHVSYINSVSWISKNSFVYCAATGKVGIFCIKSNEIKKEIYSADGLYFDQPVAIDVFEKKIYLSDWMNFRIVIFDLNLKFLCSIGYPKLKENIFSNIISSLKNKDIIISHDVQRTKKLPRKKSNKISKFLHFFLLNKSRVPLTKPNGIAHIDDFWFISDKNSHSILKGKGEHVIKKVKLRTRLGNILTKNRLIYICEEDTKVIKILCEELNQVDEIKCENVNPFCVEFLGEKIMVGGIQGIEYGMKSALEFIKIPDIHAVSTLANRVLVASRSKGVFIYEE